jgi:hypothetical protein
LDAVDKHKFPIPSGDYTRLNTASLRKEIPDFPTAFGGTLTFGSNRRDVRWRVSEIDRSALGDVVVPNTHLFEKKLNVPVDIVFKITPDGQARLFIPTLYKLGDVVRETIRIIREAK